MNHAGVLEKGVVLLFLLIPVYAAILKITMKYKFTEEMSPRF